MLKINPPKNGTMNLALAPPGPIRVSRDAAHEWFADKLKPVIGDDILSS